jgi:hypothetical protein
MCFCFADVFRVIYICCISLHQAADRFGLDRLKRLCELEMLSAISVDSAAHILFTADQHNAEVRVVLRCASCAVRCRLCCGVVS